MSKIRTTLYVEKEIWKAFKKICFREEKSMSEKIEKWMARMCVVHGDGNPQLLLDSFGVTVTKICWKCEGARVALIPVKFISGLKAHICSDCKVEFDKHRLIKKVLV